jgi:hypothetical protein
MNTTPIRKFPTRLHVRCGRCRVPGPASNVISAITMFHFY